MFEDYQIVVDVLLNPPSSLVPSLWFAIIGGPIAMIVAGEVILQIDNARFKFLVFAACVGLLGYGTYEGLATLARRPVALELVFSTTAGLLVFAAVLDWFALHIVPGWWHDLMEYVEQHEEPDSKPHLRLLSQLGRRRNRDKAASEKTARKLRFNLSRFIHHYDCDVVVHGAGAIWVQDKMGDPIVVIEVAERRIGRRKRLRFSLRDSQGHVHMQDQRLNTITPKMIELVTAFYGGGGH